MKLLFISIISIVAFFFAIKIFAQEGINHYTVIKKMQNIEIREYKKLIYVSYIPKNIQDRNNSFRNVASYIFGENKDDKKIKMTSPVVIKLHNRNEMAFIMPEEHTLKNLPDSNNEKLLIYEEPSRIKACISYSGYSTEIKEDEYIKKLKKELAKNNIQHKNDFELLVYNSPYQILNRRNEIVVSIEYNQADKKEKLNTIYFGGGCFWCVEAIFENIIGVRNVRSGFSGGKIKNPSYNEVSKGETNHAEVCEIIYNENEIELKELLNIFFFTHDPTTLNRQGNDVGKHYRSIILYNSSEEQEIILNYINRINKGHFDNKIVTEIQEFSEFYEANTSHQNYYQNNSSTGYCRLVINPKIAKARKDLHKYFR